MTTYYVGSGGNNGSNGTSWATRKLTLNGAEDVPVAAGDTVYVGPGTYRELLTIDVSGTNGNPITYIGDYTGANTDGVGGVVRITGSDNDTTTTRANCITATSKNYRTFRGFSMDTTSDTSINTASGCTNWTIDQCYFAGANVSGVILVAGTSSAITIQNCTFMGSHSGAIQVVFSHSTTTTSTSSLVQNCIFVGGAVHFSTTRIDGVTIKNCVFMHARTNAIQTGAMPAAANTVNNCIFIGCNTAFNANTTGDYTENYNTFFNCGTNRTNTNTGANSIAYPALFDPRWFFQAATAGAGPSSLTQLVTPWDLASYSQLLNVAGTSPTTTDLRGTAAISSVREWGALEYDSTLKKQGGGGPVSILPRTGF